MPESFSIRFFNLGVTCLCLILCMWIIYLRNEIKNLRTELDAFREIQQVHHKEILNLISHKRN